MKNLRNILVTAFVVALVLVIHSCTSSDEYLKFTEGGEISYTGKIDSLKFFPGRNRIKIEGLIISDPKVTELRIYWNSKKDSVVVPIVRTAGIDVVSKVIDNLEENIYNFQLKTFDSKGNPSIFVSTSAEVYGDRYISSLVNRPILSNVLIGNSLTINLVALNANSGALSSEVIYTTSSNEEKTVSVDIAAGSLVLNDFKNGSTYRYRTLYKPVMNSIDTFYTPYKDVRPIPTPVLKNAKVPFIASSTDGGRWGILANWNSNAAVKNHNGYGGWDEWNGNIFNLESGWGSPAITNGKIYQTVTAEPALYQLKVKLRDTNHEIGDVGGAYFVIAKGDGLPNIENLTTATEVLGYKRILGTSGLDYVIEFTVTTTSQISVGELTTQAGSTPGRFCNIISFELVVVK